MDSKKVGRFFFKKYPFVEAPESYRFFRFVYQIAEIFSIFFKKQFRK